jgi:hypothetical protein
LLGAILLLGIFGNVVTCATSLLAAARASGAAKDVSSSLDPEAAALLHHTSRSMHLLALIALCHVVFLTGAWMWKKWGILGCIAFLVFGTLIGMKAAPVSAVASVLWGAVFLVILIPKWKHFE